MAKISENSEKDVPLVAKEKKEKKEKKEETKVESSKLLGESDIK